MSDGPRTDEAAAAAARRAKALRLPLGDRALGLLVRGAFGSMRALGPSVGPRLGAWVARTFGPLTGAHRVAVDNIAAAFPDASAERRAGIAREAWDNLGRTACEYVHMDAIWAGRVGADAATEARFAALRADPVPTLVFAAHLANWELPAVAAAREGLRAAVLYRTPNSRAVAAEILRLRQDQMGELVPAGLFAPARLAKALQAGATVGMLVDQRFGRGPRVAFLGREATANPLVATLARRFDCPVRGARAIRLPGGERFRLELTDPLTLPRDAEGKVDVAAATQAINDVVAGWIAEHPGQWLWMHRRWRM